MNYQRLLEKARHYVLTYYLEHDTTKLVYHNFRHTEDVVKSATQIADHYQLEEQDFFIVLAAAWFHDLGYMVDIAAHEDKGIGLARTFFESHKLGKKEIELIAGCIKATKMPQSPSTLLEEIVCDADLFHLGTEDLFKTDKLMFEEYNRLHHTNMKRSEWRRGTIDFLEKHHYFTDYCKALLDGSKSKNIDDLKDKVALHDKKKDLESVNDMKQSEDGTITPLKKTKIEKPDKGIETMFRISSSNHQRLSDMADKKAHIMITVNSIILSAVISLVLRRLNEYGYLIIPSFILLTVSLLAMTFSILSTRPSIPNGTFLKSDVDEKNVNLLFFGNFYKMKLEEFNYGMQKMMEDRDFLYGSLIKDLYAQGVILGKKYHLLRIGYNIFMYGLIVAVLAFIIASAFFSHNPNM